MHGLAKEDSLFLDRASPCLLLRIVAARSPAAGCMAQPLLLQRCLCIHLYQLAWPERSHMSRACCAMLIHTLSREGA